MPYIHIRRYVIKYLITLQDAVFMPFKPYKGIRVYMVLENTKTLNNSMRNANKPYKWPGAEIKSH